MRTHRGNGSQARNAEVVDQVVAHMVEHAPQPVSRQDAAVPEGPMRHGSGASARMYRGRCLLRIVELPFNDRMVQVSLAKLSVASAPS